MAINQLKQALALTQAGRLDDAVRLIQLILTGGKPAGPPPASDPASDVTPSPRTITPRLPYDAAGEGKALPDAPSSIGAAPIVAKAPGQLVERHHRSATGQLDYLLYLPPDVGLGRPLIVMLHGCGQSPEDFAKGTGMNLLAEQAGVIVAYPRQTRAANPQQCWNWFRPADQRRDAGEAALIAGIVQDVRRNHQADPTRIYIAGLSAGGAAAANVAACYPDVFAGLAVHSGLAHGAARNLSTALSAMRKGSHYSSAAAQQFVPTITFHGERDTTVNPVNSDQIVAAAAAAYGGSLSTDIEQGCTPRGRSYQRAISRNPDGKVLIEQWTVLGADHAWSGGNPAGSYTDPAGPDASQEMLRFLLQQRQAEPG